MRFRPGHWALGGRKIGTDAVPLLRLGLPNQRPQAAFRRRGGLWPPAGRSGTGPYEKNGAFPVFCRGGTLGRPELGRESVRSLCKDIRLSRSIGAGPGPARRPTEPELSPTRTKAQSKRGVPGVR